MSISLTKVARGEAGSRTACGTTRTAGTLGLGEAVCALVPQAVRRLPTKMFLDVVGPPRDQALAGPTLLSVRGCTCRLGHAMDGHGSDMQNHLEILITLAPTRPEWAALLN
ncbi:hypothetical protein FOZ60_007431, partial [Perkinsus olseni]